MAAELSPGDDGVMDITALPAWSRAPAACVERYRSHRLGLFIHWGPVALTGLDISWSRLGPRPQDVPEIGAQRTPANEYDQLWQRFNPVLFDAKAWVALAQAAGMHYLVFTTKHHDGFSLWDTAQSDYKITNGPFGRDVVRELADACHAAGLGLGLYYSQRDWWHRDYCTPNHNRYVAVMHAQIRELLTRFGKLEVLWFDSIGGDPAWWRGDELFAMIRELQPECVVNDRAMAVLADYRGTAARWQGDFQTPEQRIGGFQREPLWESCMTLSGHQWSWAPHLRPQPLPTVLDWLLRAIGGDGNLLLNIGPDASGVIAPDEAERLRQLGAWIARYPGLVQGSRGGPWLPGPRCVATQNQQVAHLVVTGSWSHIDLPFTSVPLIAVERDGQPLEWSAVTNGWRLAAGTTQDLPAVVRLRFAAQLPVCEPLPMPTIHDS